MAVLSADEIRNLILKERLIENYIDLETQIQPNGFDCTLGSVYRLRSCGRVDFDNSRRELPELEEVKFKDWVYLPKGVYRVKLNEIIRLGNDLMAIARPRSTLVRCGANILTAVWDAGYEGRSEVAWLCTTSTESGFQETRGSFSSYFSSSLHRPRDTREFTRGRTFSQRKVFNILMTYQILC